MGRDDESATATLLSGSLLIFSALLFQYATTFVAKIAIGRFLGPTGFGVVALGTTLLAFGSMFVVLGLDGGVARYLPRDDGDAFKQGIAISALQIVLPLGVAAAALLIVFDTAIAKTFFNNQNAAPVIDIFAVTLPFAVLTKYSVGAMQGLKLARPKVIIENIAFPLTRFVAIAVALVLGTGALGVASAYALAYFVASVIGIAYMLRRTQLFFDINQYTPMHRELLTFSVPIMISTSLLLIHRNIDVLILGYFTTPDVVGTYNVVYTLAPLLTLGLRASGFIFIPIFSEKHSDGATSEMASIYRLGQKWTLLVSLPPLFAFTLTPQLAIGLTFGSEYSTGSLALIIISIGYLTQSLVGLNGNALGAIGRTRSLMVASAATAFTNVVLNFVLIPQFEEVGAAVATAMSFLVLNVILSYQLYINTGIYPQSRATIKTATIATVAAILFVEITRATVGINTKTGVVLAFVYAVLYLLILIRFDGLTKTELEYLQNIEKRYDRDLSTLWNVIRVLQ